MVSRSRVRVSRLLGVPLTSKIDWFLRRRRLVRHHRGRQGRDLGDPRLRRREERTLRDRYRIRGPQLRRALAGAAERGGVSGTSLVEVLERRLDALVWRAGFAPSIHRARRLVQRNYFTVDGEPVDVASYQVEPGQTVEVRPAKASRSAFVLTALERASREPSPPYLDVEPGLLRARLTREPRTDEVPAPG